MRRPLAETGWVLLLVAVAVPLFVLRVEGPSRVASGDSYWYMRQAQIFAGVAPPVASARAAEQVCRDINRASVRQGGKAPCVDYEVTPTARYAAIFHSRPGYPLFGAPFVAAFGPWTGMMAATLILALLAVVLAYLAVWLATGARLAGLVAGVALLLLPSGYWMTRMLVESATLAGCLAVLLGATLAGRRRRLGLALVGAGLVWLFACRSASGLAVALALLAASLFVALLNRRAARNPAPAAVPAAGNLAAANLAPADPALAAPAAAPAGLGRARNASVALVSAAVAAVALVGWAVVSAVGHLPGLNETIQDRATDHFTRPDVADPYSYLAHLNLRFWRRFLSATAHEPGAMTAVALGVVALIVRMRRDAVLWVLVGLSGFALVVAHPLISQQPRLTNPMWIPVAAALGWATALLLHPPKGADAATGDPLKRRPARPDPQTGSAVAGDPRAGGAAVRDPRAGGVATGDPQAGAAAGEGGAGGSEGGDRRGPLGPGKGSQQGGRAVSAVGVPEKQG